MVSTTVVSNCPAEVLIVETALPVAVIVEPVPSVSVGLCQQGPPGPPGDSAAFIAAEDIGGHRVVSVDDAGLAIYASASNASARTVQGLSENAAIVGDLVQMVTTGVADYPPGGLVAHEPIFLGENGLMTTTAPTSGWLRQVGVALTSTTMAVEIGPAFRLKD